MGTRASKVCENVRIEIAATTKGNNKSSQLNRIKTTKYSLLTFLPINFYDQFRRAVYFYFLVVTIISFFVNSTMSPLVSLLPLLFVMFVTGIKEAHEDYQRYRNDKIVNHAKVTVLQKGEERSMESRFICPGNLVVIECDKDVPCDVVLLYTSDARGKCFVNTANLDGESNLKTVTVPKDYPRKNCNFLSDTENMGVIECEPPCADLYNFNGKIELYESLKVLPLSADNLLLRGSRVKNTDKVIGCAVYTGMSTKLQLNSRYTGNKAASSEMYINRYLIFLVVLMVAACLILYMLGRYEELNVVPFMDYLGPPIRVNAITIIIENFLSFLILFNYMIPISMYMNIEVYRVLNAFFIQQDLRLYDDDLDRRAVVNSSNLLEDLGQINILFSDKTGTLTKNEMNFKKCTIGGIPFVCHGAYMENEGTGEQVYIKDCTLDQVEFFKALTLCHSAQVALNLENHDETSCEAIQYQASSPDEKALLDACCQLGYIYLGDDEANDVMKLKISSKQMQFKRLHTLEFSSQRKRMSVIVADDKDKKWLYTKGAESVIFNLCSSDSKETMLATDVHITKFATEGLRTLVVARKLIPEDEYEEFCNDLHHAHSKFEQRKELMEECYKRIECDLDLLGATAVEDALQDNLNETLKALQKAGIKIWVLTGDKLETAVNIALACGHISQNAYQHCITNCHTKDDMASSLGILKHQLQPSIMNTCALILDGTSLATALRECPNEFRCNALQCEAVLCCRLSPLQKSEVVKLIKKERAFLTAAIGDGANDVSMIQEADVGIGIMGREGLQAARCSDFAISKFFMLQRLLLVHGHYNTARLTFLVMFYCYKNIFITGIMVLFQLYDLYSSTSVYHSLYMWLFDVIYISFSFTFLALTEKPYGEEVLMSNPQLYRNISQNRQVRWSLFLRWIANGALHAMVVFYFAYFFLLLNNVVLNDGQTAEYFIFGSILIQLVVVVGNLKLMLEAHYLSYICVAIAVASFVGFILSTAIYNAIDVPNDPGLYHAYNRVFCSLSSWLFTIVTAVACLIPDYTLKFVRGLYGKSLLNSGSVDNAGTCPSGSTVAI